VQGLLHSKKGTDFARVLREMADRGYNVAWRVLDSQYFGVPQRRQRVYVVGSATAPIGNIARVLFDSESMFGYPEPHDGSSRTVREDSPLAIKLSNTKGNGWGLSDSTAFTVNTGGTPTAIAIPDVVWEMQHASEVYREAKGGVVPTLQARMGTGGNNVPLVGIRRFTPLEVERLQGFPDNWTRFGNVNDEIVEMPKGKRYHMVGDSITVPVLQAIISRLVEEDVLSTLL